MIRAYLLHHKIDPPDWADHFDILNAFEMYGRR